VSNKLFAGGAILPADRNILETTFSTSARLPAASGCARQELVTENGRAGRLIVPGPGEGARGAMMTMTARKSTQKDKILNSATQLFARQGYHGTSTREISRLADVSENTIFRHFDRKEDLFWSALRARCSAMKLRRDLVDRMADGDAPEIVLPKIFEFLGDILNYSPELLRLIAVAMLEFEFKSDTFCDEFLSPAFAAIGRYLNLSVRNGKIRNLDPTMVTAALTTMVLVHPWLSRLLEDDQQSYADNRDAGRAYTRFWMDVLSPRMAAYKKPLSQATEGVV
jgi:AcrR family transcriptional regulator